MTDTPDKRQEVRRLLRVGAVVLTRAPQRAAGQEAAAADHHGGAP